MRYRFAAFEFDADDQELRREGRVVEATPQVLAILKFLLVSRDRLVTKDELIDEVWEGRAISDAALTVRIRALRQALGDSGAEQSLIKTVRGRGFRFVGEVTLDHGKAAAAVPAQVLSPSCQTQDTPLSAPNPLAQIPESRPKVAVLPLELLAPAGELDLLARALPDEILTSLAKLRTLAVIARGSSFQFASFSTSPGDVRQQLGADYCLSGQMELRGERLSLALELADTRTNGALWRNAYTIDIAEIHELRQEVVREIAHQIEGEITRHELAAARLGVPTSLSAWQFYHLANAWQIYHPGNRVRYSQQQNNMKTALDYYQSAVDLDPSFARAYSGKAVLHSIMANAPWIANECDHQGQAELSIETALRLDPLDQQSHVAFAYDAARRGAIGEARSGYHRAIELSPSGVMAPTLLGRIEALRGEADRSRLMLDRLRLLSPMEAEDEYNYGSELLNRLSAGENEQAGEIARMLENRQTEMPHTLALVVAGLAHGGDNELAKTSATRLLTVAPRFTSDGFVNSLPVLTQEMADLLKAGLNKAGVH